MVALVSQKIGEAGGVGVLNTAADAAVEAAGGALILRLTATEGPGLAPLLLCLPVLLALLTSSGIALGEEVDDGIAVGVGSTGTTGTRSRWGPPLRSTPTAAPQATVRAMGRSCAYRKAPRSNERRLGCRRQEQGTSLGTSHITGYVALTKETCLAG